MWNIRKDKLHACIIIIIGSLFIALGIFVNVQQLTPDNQTGQASTGESFIIETDGFGIYRAVNRSNGLVCWTSTSCSYIFYEAEHSPNCGSILFASGDFEVVANGGLMPFAFNTENNEFFIDKSNLTIRGQGEGTRIVVTSGCDVAFSIGSINSTLVENVIIENLSITQRSPGDAGAIGIGGLASNIVFNNLHVYNMTRSFVRGELVESVLNDVTVKNCSIENTRDGVSIEISDSSQVNRLMITNNGFYTTNGQAVILYNGTFNNPIVENNICINNGNTSMNKGAFVFSGNNKGGVITNLQVSGNTINNSQLIAITLIDTQNSSISKNKINYVASGQAIVLETNASYNEISENILNNRIEHGYTLLEIDAGLGNYVKGNYFNNAKTQYALYIAPGISAKTEGNHFNYYYCFPDTIR
jgi:hypothetical protein